MLKVLSHLIEVTKQMDLPTMCKTFCWTCIWYRKDAKTHLQAMISWTAVDNLEKKVSFTKEAKEKNIGGWDLDICMMVEILSIIKDREKYMLDLVFYIYSDIHIHSLINQKYNYIHWKHFISAVKYWYPYIIKIKL